MVLNIDMHTYEYLVHNHIVIEIRIESIGKKGCDAMEMEQNDIIERNRII